MTTVMNIVGMRFSNRLLEPIWNSLHIEKMEIVFDEQLTNVAQYADLVLDEVKLQMLHHITDFTDEELKEALDAVAAEQAKKRAKRKKK